MRSISELIKAYGVELTDIIPLILLLLFWWIFSLLTAKVKKISKDGTDADSQGLQEKFLDTLTSGQPKNAGIGPEPAGAEISDAYKYQYNYYTRPGGPALEGWAKPIHPRWWAA